MSDLNEKTNPFLALLAQLAEVQKEIDKSHEINLLSPAFDYRALLSDYDLPAIDNSVIKYAEALVSFADTLLKKLADYEREKGAVIAFIEKMTTTELFDLNRQTEGENFYEKTKKQIRSVKEQGLGLMAKIDSANMDIDALAKIERTKLPTFPFMAENMARVVKTTLEKIDLFEINRDFILFLAGTCQEWKSDFSTLVNDRRRDFRPKRDSECRRAVESMFDEWEKRRLGAEKIFSSLTDFVLTGHLLAKKENAPTLAERAFVILKDYRNTIDGFYNGKRWEIRHKFPKKGDVSPEERLEVERAFFWLVIYWIKETWSDIVFEAEDIDERRFLDSLMRDVLNDCIDSIPHNTFTVELEREVTAFRRKGGYPPVLSDKTAYCEQLTAWGKSFDAILKKI